MEEKNYFPVNFVTRHFLMMKKK